MRTDVNRMCTIDPLYCWYYDNLEFWYDHPKELEKAEELHGKKDWKKFRRYLDKLFPKNND